MNNLAKISYTKVWDDEGTAYKTRVKMSKDIFNKFLDNIKNVVTDNKEGLKYKNINIEMYVRGDIERFNSSENIMYLRLTTTRLLKKFLVDNNLNPLNRNLIENTFIEIL